jgi:hypothetical protein
MRLHTRILVAAVFCGAIPGLAGAQVRVGATAGYSLLERNDTSRSWTWFQDEVTLGRSWLVGATIDVQRGFQWRARFGRELLRLCVSRR